VERVYVARSVVARGRAGHGLSAKTGVTAEDCMKLCDRMQGCENFAFSAQQRTCHFKDGHVTADDPAAKPYLDFKTYMVSDEKASPKRKAYEKVSSEEWEFFLQLNERRARGNFCPDYSNRGYHPSSYDWAWGKHHHPSSGHGSWGRGRHEAVFEPNPVRLKFDCRLWRAARRQASDLADGSSWGCVRRNACSGPEDPEMGLLNFENLESSCKYMMNPDATSVGVGYMWSYWTLEFGTDVDDVDTTCYPDPDGVALAQTKTGEDSATTRPRPPV